MNCPVCQTAVGEAELLCPTCAWPQQTEAQLLWARQAWQLLQPYQDRDERLAQLQAAVQSLTEPPDEEASLRATSSVPVPAVDYTPLMQCLKAQDWRAADRASADILVAIAQRERQGYLTPEHLAVLPTPVLQRIDDLWLQASDGHFGLSVQKDCHFAFSRTRARIQHLWPQLAASLGWYQDERWLTYEELTFDLSAPPGHLPVFGDSRVWFVSGWSGGGQGFALLMSQLARGTR
jgi:hypothetical protein